MSVVSSEEILKYVNQARTQPAQFAQYVKKEYDLFFKDNRTLPLVPGCNYSTNEGKGAWAQSIAFLKAQKPLSAFQFSKSLSLAAQDHAADMAAHKFQGHTGSDGSSLQTRINRRCQQVSGTRAWGQNIGGDFMYEGRNFALNSVKSLIIDDGVSNRGHRNNIFSNTFKYIGIGSRVVGDKIRVVMVFHNQNPNLKNDKSPSQAGTNFKPIPTQNNNNNHSDFQGFGGFKNKGGFGQFDDEDNFGGQFKGFGGFKNKGGFNNFDDSNFDDNNFGGFHQKPISGGGLNNYQVSTGGAGKYAVSTQKKTSSSTINGKTTIKTTQIIKYSDGSTETNETITQK